MHTENNMKKQGVTKLMNIYEEKERCMKRKNNNKITTIDIMVFIRHISAFICYIYNGVQK